MPRFPMLASPRVYRVPEKRRCPGSGGELGNRTLLFKPSAQDAPAAVLAALRPAGVFGGLKVPVDIAASSSSCPAV